MKVKLYISQVRSQIMYCSPVWHPHLMKGITRIEQLQCRATKYILQDINSIKNPTSSFNINSCVSFSISGTRSSGLKLRHSTPFTNKQHYCYFNCICRLWNSLPIINMNLSTFTIKNQIKSFFWKHFTANFQSH